MTRYPGPNIRDADLAEDLRHGLRGPLLAIGQFRVCVQVSPPGHDLRSELFRQAFHRGQAFLDGCQAFVPGLRFTRQAEQRKHE
ncbi:MAG: hypothetical protein MUF25_07670 [Pirellulaceae bacterium]|nr:hypothetical protein [Pirellulaceae bacterium]